MFEFVIDGQVSCAPGTVHYLQPSTNIFCTSCVYVASFNVNVTDDVQCNKTGCLANLVITVIFILNVLNSRHVRREHGHVC